MKTVPAIIPHEAIEPLIHVIRGHRVVLDADLAKVYGVTTTRLNQPVRRNSDRFPEDFAFQLTAKELANLMLQTATSRKGHGGRRKLPLAFTEHGAIMAANVLNSRRATPMTKPHPVAQTSKSAVSQVSKPAECGSFERPTRFTPCRFGNRRHSRFGNLRYAMAAEACPPATPKMVFMFATN